MTSLNLSLTYLLNSNLMSSTKYIFLYSLINLYWYVQNKNSKIDIKMRIYYLFFLLCLKKVTSKQVEMRRVEVKKMKP
jgi:hypothetical protein